MTDLSAPPPGFAFTPSDALARLVAPAAGTLTRAEGGSVPLTLAVSVTGPLRFEERSWRSAWGIEDTLAQPVRVRLSAAPDFDVDADTDALIDPASVIRFSVALPGAWQGGVTAGVTSVGAPDRITLVIDGTRGAIDSGGVGFGIERTHGGGDDGTVSYEWVPYGSWWATTEDDRGGTRFRVIMSLPHPWRGGHPWRDGEEGATP